MTKEYELLIEAEDGQQRHFRCDNLEYPILQFESAKWAAEMVNNDACVVMRLIVVENHIVRTLARAMI